MLDPAGKLFDKRVKVLVAFRQNEWGATCANGLQDFITNEPITVHVRDQFSIEVLKLHPDIRVGCLHWPECCWPNVNRMFKRTRGGLISGVYTMAYGAALHEYNGVMTILARDRRRKPSDVLGIRLVDYLFKTPG